MRPIRIRLDDLPGYLFWLALVLLAVLGAATVPVGDEAPPVVITVESARGNQTLDGFGATHIPLVGISGDHLDPELRARAIQAVYGEVRLNTGNLAVGIFEAPRGTIRLGEKQANDDGDPFHFNWDGFNFVISDVLKQKLIDPARRYGFDDFYLGLEINVRWGSKWLKPIRNKDYIRYLDECAEQVLAAQIHWRDAYGIVPRYTQLFNEPTSGNSELDPGSIREIIDIIKRTGDRARKEGFADVKFVVPGEETEAISLRVAEAILADPDARQYVGAITYHSYPYGSTYSLIANILNTSGRGRPDPEKVAIRNRLRDLGKRYGKPVWMTEVSHGGVPALSFEGLLGRAIHIHDELVYADAAAYFAMNNLRDTVPLYGHAVSLDPFADEGDVAIVDIPARKVFITGMGYALGHYARWIKRGAVRIDATSSDPLVLVTAFRDDREKRLVIVLINNEGHPSRLVVALRGLTSNVPLVFKGEQSTPQAAWAPVGPFVPDAASYTAITVPAKSVTTIAVNL